MAPEAAAPPMLVHPIVGHQAWTQQDVCANDWLVPLPDDCCAELRAALAKIRRNRLPMLLLESAQFSLGACRELMGRVRRQLDSGIMFAVLDRIPLGEMTGEEATQLYWLLSSLLARPVAQKFDGSMWYDVRDTGAKLKPGSGIRPTVTNVDLTFHNDNSYNQTPPRYVALFCLHTAKAGGVSRLMSVYTAHNWLLARHGDVLPRLYEPFWYDRHREHEPDDVPYFRAPVFQYDGTLSARLALLEIYGGYQLRGETIDERTERALRTVQHVFDEPTLRVELNFQPGQIQYVNNRTTGHARTEFVDYDEPDRKRHLVRLWLREEGKRGYCG